jgi:hypothetical protein
MPRFISRGSATPVEDFKESRMNSLISPSPQETRGSEVEGSAVSRIFLWTLQRSNAIFFAISKGES